MNPPSKERQPGGPSFVIPLTLVLGNVVVFGQVLGFDFVTFDDPVYVQNRYVVRGLTWEGVAWAFTAIHQNMSQTLPWISYMVDHELFGSNPAGFHLVNLLLYCANAVLLFVLLHRLTGEKAPSALAAALFSFHPLHVETVAWVSDRKDLLGVLFCLLMLGAYERYVRSSNRFWYGMTALAFFLALLAKPVFVTLPFLLIVLDFWPLNRWRSPSGGAGPVSLGRLVWEKTPLFVLSFIFSLVAYQGQANLGVIVSQDFLSLPARLGNALVIYALYLDKAVWPFDLSVYYPLSLEIRPLWQVAGAGLVLVALTACALWQWQKRPWWIVGWLWFLGTLFPMVGLIRAGEFEMADRYTYFPLIGLLVSLSWTLTRAPSGPARRAVWGATLVVILGLMFVSWQQAKVWENGITLFENVVRIFPDSALALNNLGFAYMHENRHGRALVPLKKALRLEPGLLMARLNLAKSQFVLKQYPESIASYREILRLDPDNVPAHFYLGDLYHRIGEGRRAIHHSLVAESLLLRRYGPDFDKTREVQKRLAHYFQVYPYKREEFQKPQAHH